MRVAYDLRYAADHFSGIGTHAFELLGACLEELDDTEYIVLWNPSLKAMRYDVRAIRRHPRVTWVERSWGPLSIVDPLRLSAWLRRLSPDVFLSPFYLNPPAAGCAAVLTLHDLSPLALSDTLTRRGRLLFNIALRAARRARGVLTASVFSRDALVCDGGLEPDRVHVVPLGVPRTRCICEQRPAHVPDGPFALVVGENRPRKPSGAGAGMGRAGHRGPAGARQRRAHSRTISLARSAGCEPAVNLPRQGVGMDSPGRTGVAVRARVGAARAKPVRGLRLSARRGIRGAGPRHRRGHPGVPRSRRRRSPERGTRRRRCRPDGSTPRLSATSATVRRRC